MNKIKPLPQAWHDDAIDWINENIRPARRVFECSSYGLKHDLDHDTGIYVTSPEFNELMEECGYKPVEITGRPGEEHHYYKIRLLNEKRRLFTQTKMGDRGPRP